MRHVRIFLLHFQNLLAHPGRPTIFAGIFIFNSLLFLAFLRGVFQSTDKLNDWNLSSITGYYFLLIIASAALMTHAEISILRHDIEGGELAGRLLKPFSYYWLRFYYELPYRLFEGVLCIIVYFLLSAHAGDFFQVKLSAMQVPLILIIVILAYMISFTFKVIVGITGLFTTDTRGLYELMEVILLIFAGYVVPLNLLPGILEKIAYLLPFSYIIYFPVVAIQGMLSVNSLVIVILAQFIWLLLLSIFFKFYWKKGLLRFTDFGQ